MVYIVTYWDGEEEPTVTPFSNREAAEKCYEYFNKIHKCCCIDECQIFSTFSIAN